MIEALGALVTSGCVPAGLVESLVCPALRPVAYDRAPNVREALFVAVAEWLGYSRDEATASKECVLLSQTTTACLLPLLLVGVTDPHTPLASEALALVEGVGRVWASDKAASSASPEQREAAAESASEAAAAVACDLGPPFTGRPGHGARGLVRELLPLLLQPLLAEVSEWTVALRSAASRQLHTVLVLGESGVAPQLPRLLPALCAAIGDEDTEVAARVIASVHVVGSHVEPRVWLPMMLDSVSK